VPSTYSNAIAGFILSEHPDGNVDQADTGSGVGEHLEGYADHADAGGVVREHLEGDVDQADAVGEVLGHYHDHLFLYSTIWKGMVQIYLALFRYKDYASLFTAMEKQTLYWECLVSNMLFLTEWIWVLDISH
jgi:hypothetical protein